jgi:hypothetical protein
MKKYNFLIRMDEQDHDSLNGMYKEILDSTNYDISFNKFLLSILRDKIRKRSLEKLAAYNAAKVT